MFNRRDLPECRHTVGSLVGSEVTVVSAASVCYPFLLVPPAKGPYTPPTRLSASNRRASCQFYRQADANDEAAKQRQATAKAWHRTDFSKRDSSAFVSFVRVVPQTFKSAWQLLYHTVAVERHFSHICHTRDPSIVTTSQPSSPHQLDPIKLQRDNMSINHSVGHWGF